MGSTIHAKRVTRGFTSIHRIQAMPNSGRWHDPHANLPHKEAVIMGSTIHAKRVTGGFTSLHRIQAMPNSGRWHDPHVNLQHKEAMDLTSMEVAPIVTSLMQEEGVI